MLRAARRAVINGSLTTRGAHRPEGSARINVKTTRPEPWARAHMQLWQLVFPISRSCESYASARGGLTSRAGEEQLLHDVAGSSLRRSMAGRMTGLAGCPPPHMLLFLDT